MRIVQTIRRLFNWSREDEKGVVTQNDAYAIPLVDHITGQPPLESAVERLHQSSKAYLKPEDVREEFQTHPRRALVVTTVVFESLSVQAFLAEPVRIVGEKGAFYEYGRFPDPAGEWLIIHAITPQGNTDAGIVITKAHSEFGSFHAQLFIGVAGSLKADIPVGSVVIGDYVYNGHSAKVEDLETHGRPHSLPPARELLVASQALIYSNEWIDLIRAPMRMELPRTADYPCDFPPLASIKGIVSGEEVVAGGNSPRFKWLRSHFNDCGAVEMEGWGAMKAAQYENTPAIVVRGISDMCAGKAHATDKLHQPIAAAHAAAFAFSILSFRSKVPGAEVQFGNAGEPAAAIRVDDPSPPDERRVEFVLNFEGTTDEWPDERINAVLDSLKHAFDDDNLSLIRVDNGSVRIVMEVRERDLARIDITTLRELAAGNGATLLGATTSEKLKEAEQAKSELASASGDLLSWERTLPSGKWMERPEREVIEARFELDSSATVLLGVPGSGKSALLSKIAADLLELNRPVFALKADFLSTGVQTEDDLRQSLQLDALPSTLILRLAALQPVYVLIDQLDALASQLDLRSGRLNVLLNLVRKISATSNVHVLLSARTFEFNHDVRLRAIDVESVSLSLPPWHEVKERLGDVGIDADQWPESARDVVRIPQALKTFIALVNSGRTEPFGTYQAMLEEFWNERVASSDDSAILIALASDLAELMADEEVLWLAASRFDDRLNQLKRLEALGILVRSENNLSVAFSHQTLFDYVLARTFVRSAGLLSMYVLQRQDSLFVRAKAWSALSYLRGTEVRSYEREFMAIWKENDLRRHLRLLLIEFLGQASPPLAFEVVCMGEILRSPELRIVGLKAIGGNTAWFPYFAATAIKAAMMGSEQEAVQASRILGLAWGADGRRVAGLLQECWIPRPERDNYTWMTINNCPFWNADVEGLARSVLRRTPIALWNVSHTASVLAVKQPEVALRLIRSKLDFLLSEAKGEPQAPEFPDAGTEEEKTIWYIRHDRGRKPFKDLLNASEWVDLPAIAEASPAVFLETCWPWYLSVFFEILTRTENEDVSYIYPGRYVLDIELVPAKSPSRSREMPVMQSVQIAVEELARESAMQFSEWADANSALEITAVQQLIARGYEVAASQLASKALEWLTLDERRFQLGTVYGLRRTTIDLIRACSTYWSDEEIARLENAVENYRPAVPEHLKNPEQRKMFADLLRATRKDILRAVGIERLRPETRELVNTEQRALGDRFDHSVSLGEGGFIGSPMEAAEMAKAKDRDILKIFREIPDNTDWDHPTHWTRGGNIQLSRAFAEFARSNSERATRLMEQFEPVQQERAAGYALDAMADNALDSNRVLDAFLDLHARGFGSKEFRESAARAIEKIARRKVEVEERIIDVLVAWLEIPSSSEEEDGPDHGGLLASDLKDRDSTFESILWGHGGSSVLPSGNFNVLSTLAAILLGRQEPGRDRFFGILDSHFPREKDPKVWKALLYQLANAGGKTPQVVSAFLRKLFGHYPHILASRESVNLLAHAYHWDDRLVFDLIRNWRVSEHTALQQAYGELVGLIAIVRSPSDWDRPLEEIIADGSDDLKVGLAHSAVNLSSQDKVRTIAYQTLAALLKGASKNVVATVMDVFRVNDAIALDAPAMLMLQALAEPSTDMSAAPSHFVVERLQALLPHEAELVAKIAMKLVAAWRAELADMRTGTAIAAPQLTDLALTLHRLGGVSRQSGVDLFEAMIEIDAYGAQDTLAEIDGRFGPRHAPVRQRVALRRKSRPARRSAG